MADRRQFITGIAVVSTGGIAGCADTEQETAGTEEETAGTEEETAGTEEETAGTEEETADTEEGPDPLVSEARNAEPRNVGTSQDGNEFTAEIRNSGIPSTILVDLHFQEDGEPSPSPAAWTNTFIENNETREVTLTAEPPAWATGYIFFYQGIKYAADVLNQGGQGDLDVWIEDLATGEVIQEQRITLTEGEERTVDFETEHEFEGDFEITAESVS